MSRYCFGTVTFNFEVERYRDRDSGQLMPLDKFIEDSGMTYDYLTLNLLVEGRSYSFQERSYGPPEDCFPSENETEILSVLDEHGKDFQDQLTPEERDFLLSEISYRVSEFD